MADVNIELLTDDDILDYTRPDGRDNIINNHKDINLNYDKWIYSPYAGGLYDKEIFGSVYTDRCLCGKIKQPSLEPCPVCNTRVYTEEEQLRRFGRINLAFYYLNDLRFEIFKDLFDKIFENTEIKLNFLNDNLKSGGYSGRGAKQLGIKIFDTCQFNYSKEKNVLTISEFITDESKCSYEGLMKIIEKNFPSYLREYRKLINHYYLVLPAAMRHFSLKLDTDGKSKKMNVHKMSIWYDIIVATCCAEDTDSNENYNEVMKQFKTPGERVRYTAMLRAMLNAGKKQATELLNTSKKNKARELYSVRVNNSARAPIVPSTTLKIDELGIPRYLAYELCREGFIGYLMRDLNFTRREAIKATKEEYDNPELQKMFKEYAETQDVLVNRQPTLHEYSIYCQHIRIAENDTIEYPVALCGPLNADFDGDTVSVTLVPSEVKEETEKRLSPRYNRIYKKNLENIFVFNHEALNGLANLSEFLGTPDEIRDPKNYYTDYKELLKDVEINNKIKSSTPITFNGKIGSVTYKNKVTTYGRLRISKILDADMDDIRVDGEKVFKNPYERINSKSAGKLMTYLYGFSDGPEKAAALRDVAYKCVTKTGVATFDYDTLYADTDSDTYKEMRKIADSDELTDKQKLLILNEKYKKYQKEVEGSYGSDLKGELDRADRVKLASIVEMNMPQFIVSGVDEKVVLNHSSLLEGLSEDEYQYHGIENRSLQAIKQSGVKTIKGASL